MAHKGRVVNVTQQRERVVQPAGYQRPHRAEASQ